MLKRLAKKNAHKIKVIKADVSRSNKWASKERVSSIPTFRLYLDGKLKKQFVGAPPEHKLQTIINTYAPKFEAKKAEEATQVAGDKPERSIRPMPKDWLPPGVTRGRKQ